MYVFKQNIYASIGYLSCDNKVSDTEAKLKAVENRFKKDSKQYEAARYIVRQNREIPKDEQKKICQEIPIANKTLQGLFTALRKMGLYPYKKTSYVLDRPPTPEKAEVASHKVPEVIQPSSAYVTKEDFETLRNSTNETLETLNNSINNLASLLNRDPSLNPGEDEEEEEYEEEEEMPMQGEMIPPGEMIVEGGSSTRESVDVKPKTRMYFDLARQGAFHNYPGTRIEGPFANFKGNISDFFNNIVDEYFIRNYNADIGLTAVIPIK